MAAKKKTPETKTFFRMKENGSLADSKNRMYEGWVGGYKIGIVAAPNKTTGKRKLMALARKLLK